MGYLRDRAKDKNSRERAMNYRWGEANDGKERLKMGELMPGCHEL